VARYSTVLEQAPESQDVRLNRGRAHLQAGNYAAALEDYRVLEEKLPASHVIQYGLGEIADKQGRREDALRHFSAYLQRAPRTTSEYTNVLQRVEALKAP
jgi:tetratricopeptide (TPR) repeat protein